MLLSLVLNHELMMLISSFQLKCISIDVFIQILISVSLLRNLTLQGSWNMPLEFLFKRIRNQCRFEELVSQRCPSKAKGRQALKHCGSCASSEVWQPLLLIVTSLECLNMKSQLLPSVSLMQKDRRDILITCFLHFVLNSINWINSI